MKREKQFCAVWMNKNMNEVSKKKKVCKDTYKKKKLTKKKSRKKSEWLWDIFERQTKPV